MEVLWTAVALAVICYNAGEAHAYQNYTVGGASGWFFDAQKNASVTDYTKWASSQTFGLGDYLIFNTNGNHSVIQTYNMTTYKNCNFDDAEDSDTFVWTAVDPLKPNTRVRVSVPLTIKGANYFFSSAMDGIECVNGLKFEVKVGAGQGLPSSLMHPPPPPYLEPSPAPADDSAANIPRDATAPPGIDNNNSGSEITNSAVLSAFLLQFFFSLALLLPNLY
ncbi:hypothetical protein KI387_016342 [Taxus chinensis]|uniref:Phytocyanin domain-containing protein n=1 Tax=Taxus chinensis TaxID=29808 RepID=A0AA38GHK6_TAXCH|nr:hypothetical protein KI387_016342 [Taxus chinensis]